MMTKTELIDRISVLLGGRVAEELIFDEVSTGAQNDLEKATDIARRMVKFYGMSEKLGLVTFEHDGRPVFLGGDMGLTKEYSEETAREIDLEVKSIIDETLAKTKEILRKKKGILVKLAQRLMEKEVIEAEELKKFLSSENEEETDGDKNIKQ
jgi:cell division protease FtsH